MKKKKNPKQVKLGKELKAHRESLGISTYTMEKKKGVSHRLLRAIEDGNNFTSKALFKYLDAINAEITVLNPKCNVVNLDDKDVVSIRHNIDSTLNNLYDSTHAARHISFRRLMQLILVDKNISLEKAADICLSTEEELNGFLEGGQKGLFFYQRILLALYFKIDIHVFKRDLLYDAYQPPLWDEVLKDMPNSYDEYLQVVKKMGEAILANTDVKLIVSKNENK